MDKFYSSSVHKGQYGGFRASYSSVWGRAIREVHIIVEYMNLSLRDTEQAFRMIFAVLINKEIMKNKRMHQNEGWKVIYLIFLRMKNFALYQDFIQNKCKSKDVINDMLEHFPDDESLSAPSQDSHDILFCKNNIESIFYDFVNQEEKEAIKRELVLITQESKYNYMYVSERIQQSIENAGAVLSDIKHEDGSYRRQHSSPQDIAKLLEWGID